MARSLKKGPFADESLLKKVVEGTFQVVRQLLENVESIGDFSGSKLYRHLQFKKNARWNADELREKHGKDKSYEMGLNTTNRTKSKNRRQKNHEGYIKILVIYW